MKRKTIRYRAFLFDKEKKMHFKGKWRNLYQEALIDAKKIPGAKVQRVEMGSPVKISSYKVYRG